ncbi:hypothetical protein NN561_016181 [Cricetulus griseus]
MRCYILPAESGQALPNVAILTSPPPEPCRDFPASQWRPAPCPPPTCPPRQDSPSSSSSAPPATLPPGAPGELPPSGRHSDRGELCTRERRGGGDNRSGDAQLRPFPAQGRVGIARCTPRCCHSHRSRGS